MVGQMRNHWWWRPGWRPGRRGYTFHVTFENQELVVGGDDLRRLAGEYQDALLGVDGVDLVPLPWLHLTMQNAGFTDEVSATDISEVLSEAQQRCAQLHAIELTFEVVEVWSEALVFRPTPADAVAHLRDTVREAITAVRGAMPEAPEHAQGFSPHVSFAYSNTDGPCQPLIEAIERVHAEPAKVTVRAASLIVLNRDERVYRWDTYGTVPLG